MIQWLFDWHSAAINSYRPIAQPAMRAATAVSDGSFVHPLFLLLYFKISVPFFAFQLSWSVVVVIDFLENLLTYYM